MAAEGPHARSRLPRARLDPSWSRVVIVALAGSTVVVFAVAHAIFTPWRWLVVPIACLTAILLALAPYSFVVADRLNDSQHLAGLSDTVRRDVRIANCERADAMCELRIRLALGMTVVMLAAALFVSAADAASRDNPLAWVELVCWIGLTAAVEYGVVRFLSDPAR